MLGGVPGVPLPGVAGDAAHKAAELGGSVVAGLGSLKGKAMENSFMKDGVGGELLISRAPLPPRLLCSPVARLRPERPDHLVAFSDLAVPLLSLARFAWGRVPHAPRVCPPWVTTMQPFGAEGSLPVQSIMMVWVPFSTETPKGAVGLAPVHSNVATTSSCMDPSACGMPTFAVSSVPTKSVVAKLAGIRNTSSSGTKAWSSSYVEESDRSRASDCDAGEPPPIHPTRTRRPLIAT